MSRLALPLPNRPRFGWDTTAIPKETPEELEELDYDGYPSLVDFAKALRRKIPGITLHQNYNSVYVLDKNPSPFVLAELGYRDYSTDTYSPNKFGVWCPRIRNHRYKYGNNKHLFVSGSIKTIVKKAAAYIRPYSVNEIAAISVNKYIGAQREANWGRDRERRDILSVILQDDTVPYVLMDLLEGRTDRFEGSELASNVEQLQKLDIAAADIKAHSGLQVSLVNTANPEAIMVGRIVIDAANKFTIPEAYSCPAPELDKTIAGKIAILRMVEQGVFAEGAGVKTHNHVYYVHH